MAGDWIKYFMNDREQRQSDIDVRLIFYTVNPSKKSIRKEIRICPAKSIIKICTLIHLGTREVLLVAG